MAVYFMHRHVPEVVTIDNRSMAEQRAQITMYLRVNHVPYRAAEVSFSLVR